MNVMRETQNFPFCSDLQSIVFFALFFVIIIMILIIIIIIIIIIIREIWLDSCDPWLLVTRSKGIFPVDQQN